MLTRRQLDELKQAPTKKRSRLALAMEMVGCTQVELAQAMGWSQSYISRLASRPSAPSIPLDSAQRLAHHFGCAVEDLFPSRPHAVAS